MKALLLTHNLPERGSYFRAKEIALRLAARGHDVDFGFVSERKKYRPDIHEHSAPKGSLRSIEFPYWTFLNDRQEGWSLFDNFWRAWISLRGRYDLVYAFSHKPNCTLPPLLARSKACRFVLDWSDWWSGPEGLYQACVLPSAAFRSLPLPMRLARRAVFALEQWWEPRVWRLADAVTLISSEFYRHPLVDRRELEGKSYVMHSGAPLEAIRPLDRIEARRACALDLPPDTAVFGYVANFHPDERLLLEAFARVVSRHPRVALLIVGSDLESLNPRWHQLVRERIIHVGRQPFEKISLFLGAADILLLPLSDVALNRARYPHKLSDYVAAGRPIVACDVGETGRLLRRYRIGWLTEPTAYAFASAMEAALALRDDWPSLGVQTRQAAERYFCWDRLCEGLFEFLSRQLRIDL